MTGIRTLCVLAIGGAVGAMAGCGGAPPPTHAQTDAVAAVRSAEALGAQSTPAAAYQLELAHGELTQADSMIQNGHMEEATRLLERAKADANLAMALRREDEARAAAQTTHSHIDQMRDVTMGSSGGEAPTTTTTAAPAATTTTTVVTTTPAAQ